MKLYAYYNDNGEIKQAEIEVKEKVILVPENGDTSFPFTYEKSIDREKVGVPIGYLGDTIFYKQPSFEIAKEIFSENAKRRFTESQKDYEQKKAALEKLEGQEEKPNE